MAIEQNAYFDIIFKPFGMTFSNLVTMQFADLRAIIIFYVTKNDPPLILPSFPRNLSFVYNEIQIQNGEAIH